MAKPKKNYVSMSVKLEKSVADRLRNYSDETSIPMTAVIEKSLDSYLKNVENQKKD